MSGNNQAQDDGQQQVSQKDLEMIEAAKGLISQKQQPPAQQQSVAGDPAGNVTGKPAQQVPGVGQQTGDPAAAPASPVEVKTAFGTQSIGGKSAPVLSSFEDVKAYAKEQGFELSKVDDIRTLLSEIKQLKEQAANVPVLQSAVNTYKTQLEGLPAPVLNLVEAAISGKDYKSLIKDLAAGVSLDLTRPFSEHNPVNLIRQYADPSITQEMYDGLSAPNKKALEILARTHYESDQAKWEQANRDRTAEQRAYQENFNKSIELAVQNLKQSFPEMDQAALKAVYDRMAYGIKDSLFNPDNTYRPDAGIKIAMQEFGQEALKVQSQTIGELAGKISSQIQGKTNEQILQRSAAPDQLGRQMSDSSNVISDTVKRETSFINAK